MKEYWLKSGFFTLISNGAMLIFAFFTFMFLVRVLPPEKFGIWVLYLTVITFAEIARNGITQNALVKFLEGGTSPAYTQIVSASIAINVTTGLFSYLIIVALAPLLSQIWGVPELKGVLWLYGIYLVFNTPLTFLEFLCMANLNFRARFYAVFTYYAANFVMVVALHYTKGGLQVFELPLIQAGASALALVVLVALSSKYLKFVLPLERQWLSKLFHFGKFVLATSFSSMLFNRMDLMMLGYFLNPIAVAVYNIPTRLSNYVEVPMNSLVSIVFPQAAMRIKEKGPDAVRYLYERSVGAMLAIIIPSSLLLAIFAEPIVLLIAGAKYIAAVPILQLFALLTLLKPFGRQGGTILDSIGYPNYNFYILITVLGINFGMNWFFIVRYGVIGAIVATLISTTIGVLIQQILLIHLINIKTHHPFIYMWAFYRDGIKKLIHFTDKRIISKLQKSGQA